MNTSAEIWIKNHLVPLLVTNGKLTESYEVDSKEVPSTIKDVTVTCLNSKETFMITRCYKAEVTIERNGTKRVYALVIKKTPTTDEESYKTTGFDILFHNEITAYTKIIPELGYTDKYPKYFYSHRKSTEAIIVLEDFTSKGWEMSKSRVNLSLEHVLLAVSELGRFHGNAYGLKMKNPEKFRNIISQFREARFVEVMHKPFLQILIDSSKRLMKNVRESDLITKLPKEFVNNLEILLRNPYAYGKLAVEPVEPLATLCHGDFLRNNIAFKYDNKETDKPLEAMLFDFQTLRYASPMIDLSTFMAMSTSCNDRKEYFDQILKCYYETLVQYLCKTANISREELPEFMTYDNILREYAKYFVYGISISSNFLMMMYDPIDCGDPDNFAGLENNLSEAFDIMQRGGEPVNKELREQVLELYDMTTKYEIDIFKDTIPRL